jgi:hypothetical protein
MAKRKPKAPIEGRWNIVSMTAWDVEETVEELQPFIEFERSDGGQFQFGSVYGEMDCRLTERNGKPAAEFSWEGHDEDEQVFGRGWAVLEGDQLDGMIFLHQGDESGFVAERAEG